LIANISGTDQAIDKRKTICSTFYENNLVNFGPLSKQMTLTFDPEIFWISSNCQGTCWCKISSSCAQRFMSYRGEKNSDENNTVRRYHADSNK